MGNPVLINFVCAAKSRGLDISRICSSQPTRETYHRRSQWDCCIFYDDRVFASIPSGSRQGLPRHELRLDWRCRVYIAFTLSIGWVTTAFLLISFDTRITWIISNRCPPQDFDMYFQHDGEHHQRDSSPHGKHFITSVTMNGQEHFSLSCPYGRFVIFTRATSSCTLDTCKRAHESLRGLRVRYWQSILFPSGNCKRDGFDG
jgi:hypothetical protein